jgi:glycerol-3-phosphate acyltransferase PlsY
MFNLNDGLLALLSGADTTLQYVIFFGAIVFVIVASYLFGSINSAIILSKLIYKDDIRKHGSGNAGMTNMLRTYGKGAALMTLGGDLLKTALAIFVAGLLFGFKYIGGTSTSEYCYMAGLFAVLGHIFPVYYGFKGGKGVLATATMALILSPIIALILIALFALVVYFSRYVSLGSVIAAMLYPVLINGYYMMRFGQPPLFVTAFATIAIAIIIVWCHRANLQRISDRTENKISFSKKKDAENDGKAE